MMIRAIPPGPGEWRGQGPGVYRLTCAAPGTDGRRPRPAVIKMS